MRPVALIALIALAAACTDTPGRAAGTRATSDPATALSPNATVVYVTDGDTIDVEVDGVEERVRLERDVEPRDAYGRLLAYVYRSDDGLFVNMEIIGQGYALPLTIAPNVAHADQFVAAARTAEAADLGLWAGCSG